MLLGRETLPVANGVLSLMESATAMYARASEIHAIIRASEADGYVVRGSKVYHFRTGPLRDFMQACEKAIDVGSRRLTALQIEATLKEYG